MSDKETAPYVTSNTLVGDKRMYELCDKCDTHTHICPGCGEPLTHSGHEGGAKIHNAKRPYCYE